MKKFPGVYKRKLKNGRVVYDAVARIDGKQRWKRGHPDPEAAAMWILQSRKDYDYGRYVEPGKLLLGEWILDYIERRKQDWRINVYKLHCSYANTHIIPVLGHISLQKLHWSHLDSFYRGLNMAPKSIHNIHVLIAQALKDAVKKGMLQTAATDFVDRPKAPRKKLPRWTAEQLHVFLKSIEGHKWEAGFRLAAFPGLRRGEILGLQWLDVDWENERVAIHRQVVHGGIEQPPKTSTSERVVPIDKGTVAALAKRYATRTFGVLWVFPDENGGPTQPNNFNYALKMAIKKTGLPLLSPHGLRRTWATIALESGVPDIVVQNILGHSDASMTKHYQVVRPVFMDEEARGVATIIANAGNGKEGSKTPELEGEAVGV